MTKLKQLFSPGKPIPLLILLLGALLMFIGFYTAISYETLTIDFGTVFLYPLVIQGGIEILIGIAITILGYLLYHGEIKYFKTI